MTIDGWTLALQLVNFLVLVWLLQRFLYKPVMGILERRRIESARAFTEAEEARRRAEAEAASYQEKTLALATERARMIESARAEIEDQRRVILADARRETEAFMTAQRTVLAEERAQALKLLRERAADVASALAMTLLRPVAGTNIVEAFLERLDERLAAMPAAERARLFGPLAGESAVRVITVPSLDGEAQKRWQKKLEGRLGRDLAVAFVADDSLIAGARIEFPQATLEMSWAEALNEAKRRLVADEAA